MHYDALAKGRSTLKHYAALKGLCIPCSHDLPMPHILPSDYVYRLRATSIDSYRDFQLMLCYLQA